MPDYHSKPVLGVRVDAELLDWLDAEVQRRGGARGLKGALVDEALSDLRSKHAPGPSPVVAAEDEQPEHAGTDRSWDSAAEIASRVTRLAEEGKQ